MGTVERGQEGPYAALKRSTQNRVRKKCKQIFYPVLNTYRINVNHELIQIFRLVFCVLFLAPSSIDHINNRRVVPDFLGRCLPKGK